MAAPTFGARAAERGDTYQKFGKLVAERRARDRGVLIISHFVTDEEAFDRVVELRDGRAVPR